MSRRAYTYYGNWAAFIKLLHKAPASLREIEAKTGIHYETLRPMMKALHAAEAVHISHWRIDGMGRASIACYALGFGVDAPKRPPKTGAQRSMKYKNKKQAEAERAALPPMRITNNALDTALRGWSP